MRLAWDYVELMRVDGALNIAGRSSDSLCMLFREDNSENLYPSDTILITQTALALALCGSRPSARVVFHYGPSSRLYHQVRLNMVIQEVGTGTRHKRPLHHAPGVDPDLGK